jgi:diguanylate cyclase (GGDEF)-like protein
MAVIIAFNTYIINKYILKRVFVLTNFMDRVAETKDTALTIKMSGKDEISKLADSTNKMLSIINSANEEISFLSYSDKLTGLKNRAHMERLFSVLDKNKDTKYHIIMGDLNGLKLTNDALGHLEGDKLLCLVSKILTESCEPDDIVSRWGGDEFVILIMNKNDAYADNVIDRIKDKCENGMEFHFKISIAWGHASPDEENQDTEAVMSLAEKRMYRNKLMEDKSARSTAINSLLQTLNAKHSETEEHTIRIKNLSYKLGKRIGLTSEKLDELELLSSLHDIGKIGIPEHVLMKPGKLTEEEWTIMKTHCEIGYRIASSSPEFAHIANDILAHHERYDGTGYPNGLKGEQIPLLARIINIVDSFDVMTHKRVYKEAFDRDYVREEYKRCAGTQFDPNIAKEFIKMLEEDGFFN